VIRGFQSTDISEVARLFVQAYSNSTWNETWSYASAYQRISELTSASYSVALVCYIDQRIMGCIISDILSWHTGKQMEIKELFVSPHYRSLGIKMEEIGKARDVGEVFLLTNNSRKLGQFYEYMGYCTTNDIVRFVKILP
jgi:hypothetical protein